MNQEMINIKLLKTSQKTRKKKETNTDQKKKTKEEKWKRRFIRTRMVFPVKKMTSVISGVFSRKKTLAGDSSEEITEADETLFVGKAKSKQNLLQKKENLWESARVRLKILILGQRLKTSKRGLINEGLGEDELCKKRILMGERCKPMNRSGILQYDGDGIFLPEP